MKSKTSTYIISTMILAELVIPVRLPSQDQQVTENGRTSYTVINLGTFGGTSGSSANGVNNNGLVTGIEGLPNGDQHAFLWVNGRKKDLGTLGGPESAITTAANENGTIIGEADTTAQDPLAENFCAFNNPNTFICLPAIWENGLIAPLPTLGGNNGEASGINNRGQAVGFAETAIMDPTCIAPQVLDFEAVVWDTQRGEVRELPPLPGDSIGAAGTINDKGQIVGTSGPTCQPPSPAIGAHIVLWQDGTPIDLGNLGGSTNNLAFGINNRGQVTGLSGLTGDTTFHAFLWQNGVMTDLGTLPGDFSSVAFGISDHGQIVGQSCDVNSNCRAFLWENGVMTDLNTLISAGSALYLLAGEWMNSRGEIAGAAFDQSTGATVPVLLTPCDGNHADHEGCGDGAQDTTADTQRPNVILPEYVREQLQRRIPFGRLRGQFPASAAQVEQEHHSNQPVLKNVDTLGDASTIAERSSDAGSSIADTRPDANPFNYMGNCEVDRSTKKLTGICVGRPGSFVCREAKPRLCPPGAPAKNPLYSNTCAGPVLVERTCNLLGP